MTHLYEHTHTHTHVGVLKKGATVDGQRFDIHFFMRLSLSFYENMIFMVKNNFRFSVFLEMRQFLDGRIFMEHVLFFNFCLATSTSLRGPSAFLEQSEDTLLGLGSGGLVVFVTPWAFRSPLSSNRFSYNTLFFPSSSLHAPFFSFLFTLSFFFDRGGKILHSIQEPLQLYKKYFLH